MFYLVNKKHEVKKATKKPVLFELAFFFLVNNEILKVERTTRSEKMLPEQKDNKIT